MRTIDDRGCVVTTKRQKLIIVIQAVANFKMDSIKDTLSYCAPKSIRFDDESYLIGNIYKNKVVENNVIVDSTFNVDSIWTRTWSPHAADTSYNIFGQTIFTYNYLKPGKYNVGLKIKTDHGCENTQVKPGYLTIKGGDPGSAHWKAVVDNNRQVIFLNDNHGNIFYSWIFGDSQFSLNSNPVHTYNSNGTYIVSCTITDVYGCSVRFDSIIQVYSHITGINENETRLTLMTLFPNPFHTFTNIQYSLDKTSDLKIELFDIAGKEMSMIKNEREAAGTYQLEINAEKYQMTPGIYLLKFTTADGYVSQRLVVY
jgi:hypothetical protein